MKIYLKTIIAFVLILLSIAPVAAQDILARQAPIDARMRAVDSVSLKRLLQKESFSNPSAMLYGNWGEHYARNKATVPDSFCIALSNFCMPTTSHIVTSDYGIRRGKLHKGVDIKVYTGDTIRAAFSGKVRIVRYDEKGFGNYIVIRHHNGLETIYGHMQKSLVGQDDEVRAGTPIGLGGSTGRTADAHLHFETRFCGIAIDPTHLFDFRNQDVTGNTYVFHNEKKSNTALAQARKSKAKEELASNTTASSKKQTHYHKVTKGETLSAIAHKHRTTVDNLCRLNRISKTSTLRLGQILKYN